MTDSGARFRDAPFERRQKRFEKLQKAHPEKVPIVLTRGTKDTPPLDHYNFLAWKTGLFGRFIIDVKQQIRWNDKNGSKNTDISTKAIFIHFQKYKDGELVHQGMATPDQLMGHVYEEFKSDDGYMYASVCTETAFGADGF